MYYPLYCMYNMFLAMNIKVAVGVGVGLIGAKTEKQRFDLTI